MTKTSTASYDFDEVELMLSVLFNGGKPWKAETAPDQDMPRSKANPKKGSPFLASKIDVERAWFAVLPELRNPQALWLYYAQGMTNSTAGKALGISGGTVEASRVHDVMKIRDAATQGLRPMGMAALAYREARGIA